MMNRNRLFHVALLACAAFVAVPAALGQSSLQADVQKKLGNSKFKNVQVEMRGSDVVLSGTVATYQAKLDADDKAHHVKGVTGVDNEITVAGGEVSDQVLRDKLAKKIAYDRVGWPDNAFNSINLQVNNGVVTLSGSASVPWAKESALSIARNMPGVRDVVDDISVDPTSPMDDQTRIAVYRRVYGQASLNKYAIDPVKPIRITVVNGNVTLTGVVDSKMDKDIAGIQANTVSGVFSVKNDLVVAGQQGGAK